MKVLVINGVNLNMLGIREKNIYGDKDYKALLKLIKNGCRERKVKVKFYHSNCEGDIVTRIQKAYRKFDGIVINPGAFTHTSIAILDALKSVDIKTVEVHISDVDNREEFRKISYVKNFAIATITNQGFDGYLKAIDILMKA